jgi:hypothetical protein
MLSLLLAAVTSAAPQGCRDTTDWRRSFATCFDPWQGFELAGAGRWSGAALAPSVSFDLRLREDRQSASKTDSVWLSLHRVAGAQWQPLSASVDATAWEFVFRRHASDTSLTLPTIPVTRLPFPFDIGLAGSVARFEWNLRPTTERWALETARFSFLFDPIRSETNQFHLAIGPVAHHRVAALVVGTTRHDVTPLTSGLLVFTAETDDGLAYVRGTAIGGALLQLDGSTPSWTSQVRGSAEAGVVLLAVNDQPLVLAARGEAWWRANAPFEWTASAALGFRLFSARRS